MSAQAALLGLVGCESAEEEAMSPNSPGLGALARRRNRLYGAAIESAQIDDAAFAAAYRREVTLLVPENELKWAIVRPTPDSFDFTGYDRIAAFARANDMQVRGHCLVWHGQNPPWLEPALQNPGKAEKILQDHISHVLRHTAPVIHNWDVLNEAVDGDMRRADGLTDTLWLRALGPGYVALAYRMAHEADPGLTLVYNDYGTEAGNTDGERRRQCILRLLEKCVADKVPVHGFGLQSHLETKRPSGGRAFMRFLSDLRSMGLQIFITELDVHISNPSGRLDDRTRAAQYYLRTYLDQVQDGGDVTMLLTWGLSDRHSWLVMRGGEVQGALPLDKGFDRAPMWNTLRTTWLGE
jgi:endo-1,4-beta-xylanase